MIVTDASLIRAACFHPAWIVGSESVHLQRNSRAVHFAVNIAVPNWMKCSVPIRKLKADWIKSVPKTGPSAGDWISVSRHISGFYFSAVLNSFFCFLSVFPARQVSFVSSIP